MPCGRGCEVANRSAVVVQPASTNSFAFSSAMSGRPMTARSIAPCASALRPPGVPRLGSTLVLMSGWVAARPSPADCMATSAIPVPPIRTVSATAGVVAAIHSAAPNAARPIIGVLIDVTFIGCHSEADNTPRTSAHSRKLRVRSMPNRHAGKHACRKATLGYNQGGRSGGIISAGCHPAPILHGSRRRSRRSARPQWLPGYPA